MVRQAQKTGEAASPEVAKVAATIKRKDAKDIASTKHKGLPMKKEELTTEAKVDKGRSDYGKASIRNYRRKGPGHGEPGMFDPEGKRGKTIELRRSEHKARRGVKGAKVPKYKVNEEGYDHYRDKKLEQGTWKEPERKNPPRKPMTDAQKKIDRANSKTALDIVKKNIRAKYGKDAIWEPKKTKKEEVEVVNEVSKKTLGSYVKKAATEIGTSAMKGDYKKMQKIHKGVLDASDKLAKEELIPEAKYEAGASTYGKASIRNKRRFGTKGENPDPLTGKKITKDATRGELIAKRREEHKAKRGMKEELNIVEDDMKGMSVKSGHKRPTKSGAGMTQKGVEAYRRKNPGSKLKTAVTTEPSKLKKGSKAANRRKSYCARSAGQMKKFPKAAKDPNSRLRQARKRWNC